MGRIAFLVGAATGRRATVLAVAGVISWGAALQTPGAMVRVDEAALEGLGRASRRRRCAEGEADRSLTAFSQRWDPAKASPVPDASADR
ncbi:hypothetical protein AB0M47_15550 [Hamadaea sp. NPDC051192]|uniref:hypothetical protein n=1 Tax=Hamadaea sp. NPDC051192 TaxID=3154940 RepID=UPI0034386710